MLKKVFLAVTVFYTLVLVIVTFINLSGVPSLGSSHDDKIYHFFAYFVLALLWITYAKAFKKKYALFRVFLYLLVFGIVLELLQHQFNPNRTYDVLDLSANCVGIIIGTLIAGRLDIIKLK